MPRLHGPTRALPPPCSGPGGAAAPAPGSCSPVLPDTGRVTGKGTALWAEGTSVLQASAVLHAQEFLGCMAVSDLHPGALRRGQGRAESGSGALGGHGLSQGAAPRGPSGSPQEMPSRWAECAEGLGESWGPDILMRYRGRKCSCFSLPQPQKVPGAPSDRHEWYRTKQSRVEGWSRNSCSLVCQAVKLTNGWGMW